MKRSIALALVLFTSSLLLAGCGGEANPTAANSNFEKGGGPILPPPDGGNVYLSKLQLAFESLSFSPVNIMVNTAGGTFEGTSALYTSDTPIRVTIPADPLIGGEMVVCTIWVPDAPASGYLDIPGDCLLFRTENMPEASGNILVQLPIMPWNRTSKFTGDFHTYRILETADGYPYRANIDAFALPVWPPIDPDETVYVTSSIPPGTGEPDTLTDDVVEPDQSDGGL